MTDPLLVNMAVLEFGLRDTLRREPHNRRKAQQAHERLVLLRDARCVGQRHRQPVADVVKPDDERPGAPDLSFWCDGTRFVVEHTTVESFDGQRRWVETGRLQSPAPRIGDEMAERRRERVQLAFDDKLGKLERYKSEAENQYGSAVSVLLLEFEDYWYGGPTAFMRAVGSLLEKYRERLPGEIHVVGTPYLYEEDIHIPTAGEMFVLVLSGYRAGAPCPGGFGPLRWFRDEMMWFQDFGYKIIPPISGSATGRSG